MSAAAPPVPVVLVVDDHHLVRLGLRTVIGQAFGARLAVAEADRIEDALAYLEHHSAQVLLLVLDLHLADSHGLTGLHLVRRRHPQLPVVVVSGSDNPRIREEAALHGAQAFLPKAAPDTPDRLLALLENLLQGQAAAVAPVAAARQALPSVRLTPRQLHVLELVLAGNDNAAIAHETGLALGSVKNCVSSVFLAFNVRSRAELIRLFAN